MFIDNSNIFHGSKAAGWRVDAKKLHTSLEERGPIWQTFFFAAVTDPPRYSQTAFYQLLKTQLHYEMTILPLGLKTITCKKCNDRRVVPVEKGIDVALATKLLVLANNRAFETAILVSGDKDYLETVKAVKSNGLRVEVVSWKGALSRELAEESSATVVFIDDIRDRIELKVAVDVEAERLVEPE
jgi:uncharacterized LabA/DUF88 family protein